MGLRVEEELNEQHANFMQMNIYFQSTAWVLFLGGLRQQESKRRAGGGLRGSVSLGIVRSVWGLQAEQSRLLTIVLMLLDPLISKYETWRVKKKIRKGKKKEFHFCNE